MGKSGKNFLWGAVIGTVAGSVTALLFAPKPGKELRQDIAEGAKTAAEKTQAAAGKVSEQSKELYSRIKTAAGNLVEDVQSRLGKDKSSEQDTAVPAATEDEGIEEDLSEETLEADAAEEIEEERSPEVTVK